MKHNNSWEKGNNEVSPVIFQLTLLPQRDSRLWWGQGGPKRSPPGTWNWGDGAESPEIKVREVYGAEYWGEESCTEGNLESCGASPSSIQHSADQCMCVRKLLKPGENASKRIKGNNGPCSHRTRSRAAANSQNGKTCNSQSIGENAEEGLASIWKVMISRLRPALEPLTNYKSKTWEDHTAFKQLYPKIKFKVKLIIFDQWLPEM